MRKFGKRSSGKVGEGFTFLGKNEEKIISKGVDGKKEK